ncbi:hypothetical protein FDJ04_gp10 [Pseudomonas phage vB_PaeM_E217]|uniref:Uncharacterized protein n=2 Tax=Pbunavirus TaxID=1198980 RepID=A0A1J0MHS7_9CAUD|nr:DUF2786 domain-containing protein [Pseudomonas aeruginosa]YP_009597845.1 hypothetical protein FDH19_gp021 [Pseudomonas phage PA5]YP_009619361.1 hypothetical protein FDJ04_gp10 [Pseudomonas phage vB_PaeM_E217]USL85157.1 hypothetical protein IDBGMNHM_00044 [Pseudomonas phage Ka2]USL88767.1 hypothetical protein [Pseudomonas phage vB_PaeM_FBPa50]APD20719.1 hypothetical protein [Pseudomonas phage PA5]ASZ72394.1 hypothetical protein vBPaeME217_00010 [Pseudomonas phage vB_PaeM_E217]UTQ79754.1 hy
MTDQNEFTPEAIEKAKDRIRKLTAMAADSSSPHEAAIAAERVKKLKDKYDLHDFEATGEIREEFDEQIATRYYSAIPNWMKFFSVAVATYNDCIMDFAGGINNHRASAKASRSARDGSTTKRWGHAVRFKGYKSDVELAVNMFNSLVEAVDRLCREYQKAQGFERFNVKVAAQFKLAATQEISYRLQSITRKRMELVSSAGTSLVVVKEAAVHEHFGDPGYKKSNVTKLLRLDDSDGRRAYTAGTNAGRNMEIVRSVED